MNGVGLVLLWNSKIDFNKHLLSLKQKPADRLLFVKIKMQKKKRKMKLVPIDFGIN